MVQKTYQIYDFENGGFTKALYEIKGMTAYREAGQVLLVIYEQNWDKEKILQKIDCVREILPKAEIVGLNHRNEWNPVELQRECSILNFFMFKKRAAYIYHYNLLELSDYELGRALNHDIRSRNLTKGAMIFLAEIFRNLDEMLKEAEQEIEEIPIFGAPSAASGFYEVGGVSYVFDSDGCYENHMLAVLFSGEDIHLRVSYNYGWTPVGKRMKVTKMDGPFRILEIDHRPAAEIYKKYLGLEGAGYIMTNISEFPLIIDRPGAKVARIPAGCGEDGSLLFAAALHEGDYVRFSYGVVDEIQAEVFFDSSKYGDFVPDGMLLIVCMNRLLFLQELEKQELDCYKRFGPELSALHGNSEIYRQNGSGGELNSALVAVGIREGTPESKEFSGDADKSGAEQEKRTLKKNIPGQEEPQNAAEPERGEGQEDILEVMQKFHIPLEYRLMNFMRAVTEDLEELAGEANAANKAKSAFLSNMSHEIRTPINAVLGLNEMILRESTDENIRDYARDIQSAGNTLMALINDILDFSRIESGRMEIVPERYDLSSMIHDLAQMTRIRVKKKGLQFRVNVSEELPGELYGDDVRIKQVLTNILTNAVKYTPDGSVTLNISGRREGDVEILRCEVEDTGIGIKEEDLPRLFDAFQRIEEKRNRRIEGTGLGMNITQDLLYVMGSHLEVESVYGKGSRFWFELEQKIMNDTPIGKFEERIRNHSEEYHYEHSFEAPEARILVADDNELNLKVFCNLLKETKVKITPVTSGRDCLTIAARRKFHIIFLDHMMPGMDGLEILEHLKKDKDSLNADTPVYVITANAVAGAKEAYIKAGFCGFLSKPIDVIKLEKMIKKELPEELLVKKTEFCEDDHRED